MHQTSEKPKNESFDRASDERDRVIAHRRSCEAEGAGLSHYILPAENKE